LLVYEKGPYTGSRTRFGGSITISALTPKGLTAAELMAVDLLRQALGGNLKALRIVLDRNEGKAR
jgi:hypothetical protein